MNNNHYNNFFNVQQLNFNTAGFQQAPSGYQHNNTSKPLIQIRTNGMFVNYSPAKHNAALDSPPMEKIPPWQQNRLELQNYPNPTAFMANSSYLDRFTETPAPIPLECQLGPETPSPSLPSSSPPYDVDTTELLRLTFSDDHIEERYPKKRRLSKDPVQPAAKRHRRTKAEIIKDKNEKLLSSIKGCKVVIERLRTTEPDVPLRVFTARGTPKLCLGRNLGIPRMKFVPQNFARVTDIGLMKTQNGLIFSCMTSLCKFKSKSPEDFQKHIKQHEAKERVKICELCKATIDWRSPIFEFVHLLKYHAIPFFDKVPVTHILYSKIDKRQKNTNEESHCDEEKANDGELREDEIKSEITINSPAPTEMNPDEDPMADFNDDEMLNVDELLNDALVACEGLQISRPNSVSPSDKEIETEHIEKLIDSMDPDFHPESSEEEDEEPISHDESTSENESVEDEPIESQKTKTKRRRRLRSNASHPKTYTVQLAAIKVKRSKRKVKKSERSKILEELMAKRQKRQEKLDSLNDDKPNQSFKKRRISSSSSSSSRSSSSSSSRSSSSSSSIINKSGIKRNVISSDISSQEITSQDIVPSLDQDKISEEIANIKCDNNKENETLNGESTANDTEVVSAAKESANEDHSDFMLNIPKEIAERIAEETKAKCTNQIKPKFNPVASEEVEIDNSNETSNVLNASPALESTEDSCVRQSPKKKRSQPTARKSTSLQSDLCKKYGIRNCVVSIPTLIPKLVIKNATNPELATVSAELTSSQIVNDQVSPSKSKITIISNEIIALPGVDGQSNELQTVPQITSVEGMEIEFEEERETTEIQCPEAMEDSSDVLNCSQASDGGRIEIDYEEEELKETDEVSPLEAAKDFPAVLNFSQASDGGRIEIDYEEEELKETDEVSPLEAAEDFPAVLNFSQASDDGRIEIDNIEEEPRETDSPLEATKDFPAELENISQMSDGGDIEFENYEDTTCLDDEVETKVSICEVEKEVFFDALDSVDLTSEPSSQEQEIEVAAVEAIPTIENNQVKESHKIIDVDQCNLALLYPWIDDDITEKMFKSKSAAKDLIKDKSLFSTYKCMSIDCSYFTTDKEKFKDHIECHRDTDRSFICSFCLTSESQPEDLITHLKLYHKYDRYQCSACMYRSGEKFYCDIHKKKFHPGISTKIYKSPVQTILKKNRKSAQIKLKKDFVFTTKICKLCRAEFTHLIDYKDHLASEHQDTEDTNSIQIICEEIAKISDELVKTGLCEFGLYQCVYCDDSFNDENFMKDHLSELHPHKFAFICKREKAKEIKIIDLVDKEEMKKIKITNCKNEVEDLTGFGDSIRNESETGILIMEAFSLKTNEEDKEEDNTNVLNVEEF